MRHHTYEAYAAKVKKQNNQIVSLKRLLKLATTAGKLHESMQKDKSINTSL